MRFIKNEALMGTEKTENCTPNGWGGKRVGAGRKPKTLKKESDTIPEPRKGLHRFVVRTDKRGRNGSRNVNRLAPTVKQKEEYKRKIREGIEGRFKCGNYIRCPDDLDRDARDEWNALMASYSQMDGDFLSTLDTSMLRLFCESYSRYTRATRKWVTDFGCKVVGDDKDEQAILDRLFKLIDTEVTNRQKLAPDLGLTPAGRAKAGQMLAKALVKKDKDGVDNARDFLNSLGE